MKASDLYIGMDVAFCRGRYSIQYQDKERGRVEFVGSGRYAEHRIKALNPSTGAETGDTHRVGSRQIVSPWSDYEADYKRKQEKEKERLEEQKRRNVITELAREQAEEVVALLQIAGVDATCVVEANWAAYGRMPAHIRVDNAPALGVILRDYLKDKV